MTIERKTGCQLDIVGDELTPKLRRDGRDLGTEPDESYRALMTRLIERLRRLSAGEPVGAKAVVVGTPLRHGKNAMMHEMRRQLDAAPVLRYRCGNEVRVGDRVRDAIGSGVQTGKVIGTIEASIRVIVTGESPGRQYDDLSPQFWTLLSRADQITPGSEVGSVCAECENPLDPDGTCGACRYAETENANEVARTMGFGQPPPSPAPSPHPYELFRAAVRDTLKLDENLYATSESLVPKGCRVVTDFRAADGMVFAWALDPRGAVVGKVLLAKRWDADFLEEFADAACIAWARRG